MCIEGKQREAYIKLLEARLSPKRVRHSLGVEKEALRLARRFGVDEKKAQVAALLHDVSKGQMPEPGSVVSPLYRANPELLHGRLGAEFLEEALGIEDQEILLAVRYHTTGRAGMTDLEKVIYLADLIEENRDFPGLDELRAAAARDLDEAVFCGMQHVLSYVLRQGWPIDEDSIRAYNDLIFKRGDSR